MVFARQAAVVLVSLLLAGAAHAGPRTTTSSDGHYVIEYDPSPTEIEVMQSFDMTVRVRQANGGQRVCDGVLKPDLIMPDHGHGMTVVPQVVRRSDCSYRVEGMMMHMPGLWELVFEIEHDGQADSAYVTVEIWGGD